MIYLDNAATTRQKPPCVIQAVTEALQFMGNAGRGGHDASLGASRIIFQTRDKLAELFGGEAPDRIAFTSNATEALNISLKGILESKDHVITTELEHNSVLRPLYELEKKGIELTIIRSDGKGCIHIEDIQRAIRKNTRMIVCTHGSNLTGNLIDIGKIGELARRHGGIFVVDASQTAGIFPIDVQKMKIDVLCFTGHKGLLGPQGVGGLYVRRGISVKPLKSGGSGICTYSKTHPDQMPEALEAGTLNGHGIAGLGAALDYLKETGIDEIRNKELRLMWQFYEGVSELKAVTVYGDFSQRERCPIVSCNLGDYDSGEVSDALYEEYGICTRPGGHCAPLLHQALGIAEQGAVRFSFSHYNTEEEVEVAVRAMRELVKN